MFLVHTCNTSGIMPREFLEYFIAAITLSVQFVADVSESFFPTDV